jgi:uncharacterized protein YpiB (UPF0302 family)
MSEMEQAVSINEKRTFLKWLLRRRKLVNRETVRFLLELSESSRLLPIVHFVEDVSGSRRSMTLYEEQTSSDFVYVKESVHTHDPEKAFHDLRINHEEELFVRVVLSDDRFALEYLSVLEDGPMTLEKVHRSYGAAADAAIRESEKHYSVARLEQAINAALDQGDRTSFYRLSEQLKKLSDDGQPRRLL